MFFSCFEGFYFFVFCVLLLFYVFLSCISLTSFFFDFDVGECVQSSCKYGMKCNLSVPNRIHWKDFLKKSVSAANTCIYITLAIS